MKIFSPIFFISLTAIAFLISGCDKTKPYDITVPPAKAHFDGTATQVYPVLIDPAPVYNLKVGSTDVSGSDRIVTYKVTSNTGATPGTQYSIDNNGTITIPADKAEASIDIRANFSAYASGRIDTLVFTLSTPSLDVTDFMDTVILVIKGPSGCSEDLIILNDLLGNYNNTNETFGTSPYGPYVTSISSVTLTSPTTGTIVVENIWDNGWGPISFDLDWTDPNNRTCVVVQQDAIPGSDAGDINATYAGQTVAVKVPSAALSATPGTYSYCDHTLTLKMQLGVTALGYFNALYTVNMAR